MGRTCSAPFAAWDCFLKGAPVAVKVASRPAGWNMPVNMDAHGRPLPAVAPFRGRRLRLRSTSLEPPPARSKIRACA